MSGHQVGRLEVEFTVADVDLAAALGERVSRLLGRGLAATIDRVCGEVSGPERLDRLDRLTLDLGRVGVDSFEGDLLRALEPALRRALLTALGDAMGQGERGQGDRVRASLERLEVFALTGNLPWSATPWPAQAGAADPIGEATRALVEAAPVALFELLGDLTGDPRALARLAAHLGDDDLAALVGRRFAGAGGAVIAGVRRLAGAIEALAGAGPRRQAILREAILVAVGRVETTASSALVAILREASRRGLDIGPLAGVDGLREPPALRRALAEVAARARGRQDPEESPIDEARDPRGPVDAGSIDEEHAPGDARRGVDYVRSDDGTRGDAPERPGAGRDEPGEPGEPIDPGEPIIRSDSVDSPRSVDGSHRREAPAPSRRESWDPALTVDPEGRRDSPDNARNRPSLESPAEIVEIARNRAHPVDSPTRPESSDRPPARRDLPTERRARAARERLAARRRAVRARADELYVDDAGLVILWPFLERLFARAGLLGEDRRFTDEPARAQAIALLAVCAREDPEPPEPALPLAKLLCGAAVDAPFALERPLVDAQLEECERLLLAVVDHLPALAELDANDLRATFLRRPAALAVRDGIWTLEVERRPQDLALERCPWTWRWLRLPWMAAPLRVEW